MTKIDPKCCNFLSGVFLNDNQTTLTTASHQQSNIQFCLSIILRKIVKKSYSTNILLHKYCACGFLFLTKRHLLILPITFCKVTSVPSETSYFIIIAVCVCYMYALPYISLCNSTVPALRKFTKINEKMECCLGM